MQPNSIEFDLALEWRLLLRQHRAAKDQLLGTHAEALARLLREAAKVRSRACCGSCDSGAGLRLGDGGLLCCYRLRRHQTAAACPPHLPSTKPAPLLPAWPHTPLCPPQGLGISTGGASASDGGSGSGCTAMQQQQPSRCIWLKDVPPKVTTTEQLQHTFEQFGYPQRVRLFLRRWVDCVRAGG